MPLILLLKELLDMEEVIYGLIVDKVEAKSKVIVPTFEYRRKTSLAYPSL